MDCTDGNRILSIPADVKILSGALSRSVNSDASVGELAEICSNNAGTAGSISFPLLFASVSLFRAGRIEDSIKILLPGFEERVVAAVHRLVSQHPRRERVSVWQEINAFDVWSRTGIAQRQRELILERVPDYASSWPLSGAGQGPSILDLGVGNGVLLVAIANRLAEVHNLSTLHLILVDTLPDALQLAAFRCREQIQVPVTITTLCRRIQDIEQHELIDAAQGSIWIVHAAACIHHLVNEVKSSAIKKFSEVAETLVVNELEANHGTPMDGSAELVWSATGFYGELIHDLWKSDLSEDDKRLCEGEFLAPELVGVLYGDMTHRENYHLPLAQWRACGSAGGVGSEVLQYHDITPGGLRTMTLRYT